MTETTKTDFQAGQEGSSAAAAHPWDCIDVSAWFDTSMLINEETGRPFEDFPSDHGFYREVPGETSQSWWAAAHPEEKKEARAASLAVSLEQARKKAEQSPGTEDEAHYKKMRDAVLLELAEMADKEAVVTANAVLGRWHAYGRSVERDAEKAKKHLLRAAEAGDPYSAFLLAHLGCCPERTEELYRRSLEASCPTALVMLADLTDWQNSDQPAGALETAAAHLAALAAKKEFNCLRALVLLLHEPAAAGIRQAYAGFVLDLVNKAAEAGVADAYALLGRMLMRGELCGQDAAKAEECLQKALQKGSGSVALEYAARLLEGAQDLPKEEKAAQMQEAYALLREKGMGDDQRISSCALLGRYLTLSDNDKEFQEGMDWLDKCLDECFARGLASVDLIVSRVTDSAETVLLQQASPQRRAQALKLLDRMAGAGSAHAMRLKGIVSLMGLCGREAREQGIEMLLEAGQRGDKEAWTALAEIYAFGLCGFGTDLRQALLMAMEGDKAGSEKARFLRALLELGEFSEEGSEKPKFLRALLKLGGLSKPDASIADLVRDPRTSAMALLEFAPRDDDMGTFLARMVWLGASDLRSKVAPLVSLSEKPHPAHDFEALVSDSVLFSQTCVTALACGQIPLAAFCVHVLKKISRTEYCQFYVGPLAVMLGMSMDASAAEVIGFLNEYLAGLPESICRFLRDREEDDSDLELKFSAWLEHMRAAVGK